MFLLSSNTTAGMPRAFLDRRSPKSCNPATNKHHSGGGGCAEPQTRAPWHLCLLRGRAVPPVVYKKAETSLDSAIWCCRARGKEPQLLLLPCTSTSQLLSSPVSSSLVRCPVETPASRFAFEEALPYFILALQRARAPFVMPWEGEGRVQAARLVLLAEPWQPQLQQLCIRKRRNLAPVWAHTRVTTLHLALLTASYA